MHWFRNLGEVEYIFIGLFIIFYILYFIRIWIIKKRMKASFTGIFFKFLLRSCYFSLIIISLLGPSFGNIKKEVKAVGKDIYLVIDLSLSMNAIDIAPSRLERAKDELKNLVKSLSSDKIGLIIFSEEAYIQCPLTFDKEALEVFINALNTELVDGKGSNLEEALKLSLNLHLKETKVNNANKCTVLVSDGEDFGENLSKIVNKHKKNNIKLFTLGIGTSEGSKIPLKNGFKKDKMGNHIITHLNSFALEEIASETNGKYYEINKSINEMPLLINSINKIEGSLRDTKKMDIEDNKYYYFLLGALFFIIIDLLVTVNIFKF